MKLIVNADDFGMSAGTTYGIYQAIKEGIVTSTTLMVNGLSVDLAADIINRCKLNVGLHFNISLFAPLTDCPSLVRDGRFVKPKHMTADIKYQRQDILKELQAQYNRFIQLTGKRPTHIDSHLYTHQHIDEVKDVVKEFAMRLGIAVRDCNTRYPKVKFVDLFKVRMGEKTENVQRKLVEILQQISTEEVAELMVHPAYLDEFLLNKSSYSVQRVYEYAALVSSETKQAAEKLGIQLIGYGDLEQRGENIWHK